MFWVVWGTGTGGVHPSPSRARTPLPYCYLWVAMGCTPSKSTITYTHERVCKDLDTCSTFVPSLKSSVSTPERPSPRLCVETSSGKQTFLSGK